MNLLKSLVFGQLAKKFAISLCRADEIALLGTSAQSTSKNVNLDGSRRMALKNVEAFVMTFSDPQAFAVAASSFAPAALTQITESARIQEAGHLRCRCTSFPSEI